MIEIDNQGLNSASKSQIIRFRDAWLPLRHVSLLQQRRDAERPG